MIDQMSWPYETRYLSGPNNKVSVIIAYLCFAYRSNTDPIFLSFRNVTIVCYKQFFEHFPQPCLNYLLLHKNENIICYISNGPYDYFVDL